MTRVSNFQLVRTERGWSGHFVSACDCRYRRNTLISSGNRHVVISTVGAYCDSSGLVVQVGRGRYYETRAFIATRQGAYTDADITQEIEIGLDQSICAKDVSALPANVDSLADEMHERNVKAVWDSFDSLYKATNNDTLPEA